MEDEADKYLETATQTSLWALFLLFSGCLAVDSGSWWTAALAFGLALPFTFTTVALIWFSWKLTKRRLGEMELTAKQAAEEVQAEQSEREDEDQ